ncbi:MAG: hypothetical protein HYT79_00275 [Elusimicrobia bacterium]|nr:hypothetical protein [Elusimicrobiota bacterium]
MKNLEEFVRESGGRAKAAIAIGIAETTLWRWLENRAKPRGLARRRLSELGIKFDQPAGINKIAQVLRIRPAAEAFEKSDQEMLLGMLSMPPGKRVADVDALRVRLWGLGHAASQSRRIEKVARILRRSDAQNRAE